MAYDKKIWHIDDIVKPEDAQRWEDQFEKLDTNGTASSGSTTINIISDSPPIDPNDYFIDFIATEDYSTAKSLTLNGKEFTTANIRDIQQNALKNGAWKTGAPIRLRVLGDQVFLAGGGGGSLPFHIGTTAPTDESVLMWFNTSDQLIRFRTVAGSTTWLIARGTYNA